MTTPSKTRYQTWLLDRGPNPTCTNAVERDAGGDPRKPTPYVVAQSEFRSNAEQLRRRLEGCSARAEVREA